MDSKQNTDSTIHTQHINISFAVLKKHLNTAENMCERKTIHECMTSEFDFKREEVCI